MSNEVIRKLEEDLANITKEFNALGEHQKQLYMQEQELIAKMEQLRGSYTATKNTLDFVKNSQECCDKELISENSDENESEEVCENNENKEVKSDNLENVTEQIIEEIANDVMQPSTDENNLQISKDEISIIDSALSNEISYNQNTNNKKEISEISADEELPDFLK